MNRLLTFLNLLVLTILISGCKDHQEDIPVPVDTTAKRTVLIYAVASNNLASALVDDKTEMVKAAPEIEGLGTDVRVILYSVPSQSAKEATLAELVKKDDGNWTFEEFKSYDRNTFSTDPVRIREVLTDLRYVASAEKYGLILWTHGTGWIPNFSEHQVPSTSDPKRSFGLDRYQGVTDYCDLKELKRAIPDRMFDYIWFDLCYMMGVEVVYELRNKCDFIGGYPTEDWSPGMNYDVTLPLLAAPEPDLAGAGEAFFNYYAAKDLAVTVTVMKTDGLDRLSAATAAIYSAGHRPENASGLMNYSRLTSPLYDFGQYTAKYLDNSEDARLLLADFHSILDDMTIYAACSTKNFNGVENAFDPSQYSGLSVHFAGSGTNKAETYYNSLDWTVAVKP